jgi:hypothetical protein
MRIGLFDPRRRTITLCLTLGLLSLGIGLALADAAPAMIPLVGAAGLGLAAGFAGLRGELAAPTETVSLADLQRLLSEQRQEGVSVTTRLAGVALEAETRLSAGARQAEQALHSPAGALGRAAAATRRAEQTMTDLAELLTKLTDQSQHTDGEAAQRLRETIEIATASFERQVAAMQSSAADAAVQVAEALLHASRSTSHVLSTVPTLAGQLVQAADTMRAEATRDATLRFATGNQLEEVARQLQAAAPGLDRIESSSQRLTQLTTGLPAVIEQLIVALPASVERMARDHAQSGELVSLAALDSVIAKITAAAERQDLAAANVNSALAGVYQAMQALQLDRERSYGDGGSDEGRIVLNG